ncbi:MAG: GDP-mannose 4,6-dehydratase [Candidatus Heimdallarchaeota archaeon]|nr:MAG: GDP-mannose 4,6-dehydratase [Candidatus Heimdallarchaeota archaeon]
MKINKTALITGTTGQDGSYLSELLLEKGYKVYGLIRRSSVNTTERITHLINKSNFELIEGDITDSACIYELISGIKPNEVYNLAAMSHVGTSFKQPVVSCTVNAIGPLNILEAIRQTSPKTKFYQASTSELFGNTDVVSQSEITPMKPNSPYAISKLYAHQLVNLYRNAYNVFACAGILFNHESPRRGENFVTKKITKYVAMLLNWMDLNDGFPTKGVDVPPLFLGNIGTKRDWSHAKDMVYGMWLMLQYNKPDDYVLGSGKTHSVENFLDIAFAGSAGLDYKDYVVIDKKFYRPMDINLLCADSSKAKRVLGWKPTIHFTDMIDCMVQDDYEKLIKCRD